MKKILPIAGATLVLALLLAGCSADNSAPPASKASKSATPTPSPTASKTPPVKPVAGEVAITFIGQGEKGADGNYAKFPVQIKTSVTSITKISDAEMQSILSVAKEETKTVLTAFDLYKVVVHEIYVSGNDPKYQSSYTEYNVLDSKGVRANDLPLIGFDWCKSSSFTKEFVTGTPNESCLLGAVPKGSDAPSGVQFAQYGTPSEKAPIKILK